jgi:methyltransferase (TIGR00027 family)
VIVFTLLVFRSSWGLRLSSDTWVRLKLGWDATQTWKRERLASASIPVPASPIFVPDDFERQTLAEALAAARFDPAKQTFFTWLGVVPYLTEAAFASTIAFIAGLPNGAHVVFDYSDPPGSLSPELRASHDKRAAHVAALGEAWITYFAPQALHARLASLGFREIEDLGPREIALRYLPSRAASAPERGGHILRATTIKSF